MSDEGDGDKDFEELGKQSLQNIDRKILKNGPTEDRWDMVENGRLRVGQGIEDDGVERVVQQPQLSQGASVCWERFLHVRSVRVLLVENDDSTRHVVAALLRNCSYEVLEASNGLQAWKILEDLANRIDVILTEVVMPCCSGIALLCKIMSHKTRKNVPVIMMSSHDSMGLVFKCLSKGAVDFLVKPIRKNELKNLWQHVWRRCHSSSGSGSESGTQSQKSIRSRSSEKSANNSGSSDEADNGSPALNLGDGSDHGSGTQSSWTKQAAEDPVDSPRLISNLKEVPKCPDSTCAQVIIPNTKSSGKKLLSVPATEECGEQKDSPGNSEPENVLDNTVLKIFDQQPKSSVQLPTELTSVNQHSAPKVDSIHYSERIDNSMRDFQEKKESTMSTVAINFSKKPEINDNETDENRELPSSEQGLKRPRGEQDVQKSLHDERNVIRRSESSAFFRYNALTHNKVVDAQSTTPQKNDAKTSELRPNIQSYSRSDAIKRCSDGVDLIFTSHNRLADTMASKNKTVEHPFERYSSPSGSQDTEINPACSSRQVILEGVTTVKMVVPLVCSTEENQVQTANCQHITSNHDDLLMKNLSELVPHCGSSTVLGRHLEGNAGNYSVNRSASGSNYGSNGPNGSSSGANAGIMNMESDNGANGSSSGAHAGIMNMESDNGANGSSSGAHAGIMNMESDNGAGGKSGSGDASGNRSDNGNRNASGTGSGSKVDQNKLAQREAALTKFRQKRKARCFRRKV